MAAFKCFLFLLLGLFSKDSTGHNIYIPTNSVSGSSALLESKLIKYLYIASGDGIAPTSDMHILRKRNTIVEEENPKDDLETSERIIFRPLFRYRQIVAERERRYNERQEIRRMEYCKKYGYRCWPQFKERYYNSREPYAYSNQYASENYLYNINPYYIYRPNYC